MDLGSQFAFELGQVSRKWRTRVNARLRHTGMSQPRWYALLQLSKLGPVSQTELAGQIGIEGPTLVRLLDALEKQGLIERQVAEGDRRVKIVRLTPGAQPILKAITEITNQFRNELFGGIPQEELAAACRLLQKLTDRLEKL
jgi:MarR family transcriptional regulator for hemolysin